MKQKELNEKIAKLGELAKQMYSIFDKKVLDEYLKLNAEILAASFVKEDSTKETK